MFLALHLELGTKKKALLILSTGRVPSPTLNELPTAEDVEAMIESMRAREASLRADNEDQQQPPSQGSAPPSVASLPATVTSSPSQPQRTPVNGETLHSLNMLWTLHSCSKLINAFHLKTSYRRVLPTENFDCIVNLFVILNLVVIVERFCAH